MMLFSILLTAVTLIQPGWSDDVKEDGCLPNRYRLIRCIPCMNICPDNGEDWSTCRIKCPETYVAIKGKASANSIPNSAPGTVVNTSITENGKTEMVAGFRWYLSHVVSPLIAIIFGVGVILAMVVLFRRLSCVRNFCEDLYEVFQRCGHDSEVIPLDENKSNTKALVAPEIVARDDDSSSLLSLVRAVSPPSNMASSPISIHTSSGGQVCIVPPANSVVFVNQTSSHSSPAATQNYTHQVNNSSSVRSPTSHHSLISAGLKHTPDNNPNVGTQAETSSHGGDGYRPVIAMTPPASPIEGPPPSYTLRTPPVYTPRPY